MNILLVEDSYLPRVTIQKYLTRLNHTVTAVEHGAHALRLIESGYDIFLLDINLPDMTGYDIARVIRERGLTEHIVAISNDALGNSEKCYSSGFDAVYRKPISFADVEKILNKITYAGTAKNTASIRK